MRLQVAGQHQHLDGFGELRLEGGGDVHAVQAGQAQVQQQQLGTELPHQRIHGPAVAGFRNDFEAGLGRQQHLQAVAHERVVFRENDPGDGAHGG
ncbi:hypothetical protein D9M73_92670 [compost metagenome]